MISGEDWIHVSRRSCPHPSNLTDSGEKEMELPKINRKHDWQGVEAWREERKRRTLCALVTKMQNVGKAHDFI